MQEVESPTAGIKVQIVFERQADISPEALSELIQQVDPLAPLHPSGVQAVKPLSYCTAPVKTATALV